MTLTLLWIIQLAPLLAFVKIFSTPVRLRRWAPLVGILASAAAAAAAVRLWILHGSSHGLTLEFSTRWLAVSDLRLWPGAPHESLSIEAGFLVDPLNLLMITLVTVISFFVQLFSYYYMAGDSDRPRYFAFLSFFSFAMTGLVLSNNLLQTFVFWELVGLASYLLIGFWFQKPSAAEAARKAFVINRLADLGFYLGVIGLLLFAGTLNFQHLGPRAAALPPAMALAAGLLVLTGVMGKSAQFPFHVWLPDAMEGPTPVSALIHSATMVAAGVFLLVRAYGLFAASAAVLDVTLVVGSLTALTGAFLAVTQRDIKKILAYSTISQLGLMVMGIGAGHPEAGMFHLTTHACFKSMLFLTAGAFIHRFHTNDIWEIGRAGGRRDLVAVSALGFGLLSLSGLFPLSGFFSKDLILEALRERGAVPFATGILVSFVTAYYSFRLLFVVLLTRPHAPAGGGHGHAHSEGALLSSCRVAPLACLALLSLAAGISGTEAGRSALLHWLGAHPAHLDWGLLAVSTALVAGGGALAFALYRDPERALEGLESGGGPLRRLLDRKLYVDDAYTFLTRRVGLALAAAMDAFDRAFVNGVMVNGTSRLILRLGSLLSRLQNGFLQDYLAWAVAAAAIVVLVLFSKGT